MIERLEERALLTVALDANGWTQVTPTPNVSQQIYVSSSTGSNGNNGLSQSTPVATIAHALTLVHNNAPDWVLLKRGDTFSEAVTLNTSGADAQDPMVFTSYGDTSLPRPVVDSGSSIALSFGTHLNHFVDVIGISFTSSTADPSSPKFTDTQTYGLDDLGTSDVLVEDCSFQFFIDDLVIQGTFGPVSDVTIRRNEILDAYSSTGHAEGLYAETMSNLTLSENIFDHDGWNTTAAGGGATGYNHDAYIHSSCVNSVITGNVFAEASSTGLQARAGGVVDNNLFVNDPYGLNFGLVNGATTKAGGVTGEVMGNVIIEPRVDTINSFGIGMQVGNLAVGGDTVISNNIVADGTAGVPSYFFTPGNGVSNVAQEAGLNSLTFSNNTSYNWGYGLNISSLYVDGTTGANGLTDVAFTNNRFQGNLSGRILVHGNAYSSAQETWSGNIYNSTTTSQSSWFSLNGATTSLANWKATVEPTAVAQALPFADPTRTIETYMASQGLPPTLAAYVAGLRAMSKTNWNTSYLAASVNSYIQAGFSTGTTNPAIALTGKTKANAGGIYTLHLGAVNDPGQTVSQYTVNWGDGSSPDTYTSGGAVTHPYTTAGPVTISVNLTDGNGIHTGAGTLGVTVVSQPTLGLSGNAAAFVGQAYSLTIDPSGDLGGTPQQFTINWGDGSSSMYPGSTTKVVVSHVYSAAQSESITADLVDDTGTFLSAGSATVTVVPAPSATLTGAASTNVGAAYTLTLSDDTDPAGTVSSFVVHWGDNTSDTPTALGDITHVYHGAGAMNIVVDTVDENGTFLGAGSLALTVNQPAIGLGGPSIAPLNQPYTLTLGSAFDPNETITGYTIHWGDGQTDTPTVTGDFQHTYSTSGAKMISVDLTDGLGTYIAAGTLSLVVPTVPTLTLTGNADANVGGTYSLTLASVTDLNGKPSQYLVDWGDGSTSASTSLTTLTHTFSASETISVDVTDATGTYAAVGTKKITVNSAPKIILSGAATATTGVSYSLTLGAVTDPGYTATNFTVHWGDGTISTATAAGVVKHTYTAAVNATLTVDLTDSTGTFASAGSLKVAVTAPLFTKSIDIGAPAVAGSASYSAGIYTVTGAGTDFVSTSDKFHYDYTTVTGNKTIAAQVTSLTNTASLAKAGVMFRNGTAANAAFADMAVTPSGELEFQWRTTAGGAVSKSTLTGQAIPRWVKLVRTGSSFAAWYSSDGKTWKQLGTSHTISMTTVNVGLAVTSLVTTKTATAKFANVSLA